MNFKLTRFWFDLTVAVFVVIVFYFVLFLGLGNFLEDNFPCQDVGCIIIYPILALPHLILIPLFLRWMGREYRKRFPDSKTGTFIWDCLKIGFIGSFFWFMHQLFGLYEKIKLEHSFDPPEIPVFGDFLGRSGEYLILMIIGGFLAGFVVWIIGRGGFKKETQENVPHN